MCTKGNKLIILIGIILLCTLAGCGSPESTTSTPAVASTATTQLSPTQNPYPPYTGKLILSDPLKDNSKGYAWDETTIGSASCGFSEGVYHVIATAPGGIVCNPEAKNLFLSNLTYEISLKVIQGSIEGIAFRFNQNNTGYVFSIGAQQGTYALSAANGNSTSTPFRTILSGSSKAISEGLNQSNLLAAVADGSTISLYINHQFITKTNDSTYSQGQLGIFTADSQGPADVKASNARAWIL